MAGGQSKVEGGERGEKLLVHHCGAKCEEGTNFSGLTNNYTPVHIIIIIKNIHRGKCTVNPEKLMSKIFNISFFC